MPVPPPALPAGRRWLGPDERVLPGDLCYWEAALCPHPTGAEAGEYWRVGEGRVSRAIEPKTTATTAKATTAKRAFDVRAATKWTFYTGRAVYRLELRYNSGSFAWQVKGLPEWPHWTTVRAPLATLSLETPELLYTQTGSHELRIKRAVPSR